MTLLAERRASTPVHDDLVNREFTATAPNVTWLTGITQQPTSKGKLYLCAIKDQWSTRIVGYSMVTAWQTHSNESVTTEDF